MTELVGLLMFMCFSTALIPQIVHILKVKQVCQINIWTIVMFMTANILGITYNTLSEGGIFITVDYSIGMIINMLYLLLCLKYKKIKKGVDKG